MFGLKLFRSASTSLSREQKGAILKQVAGQTESKDSLRSLLANALGSGTSPNGELVTSLLTDIRGYAFPGKTNLNVAGWWDASNAGDRKSALELAAAHITSR